MRMESSELWGEALAGLPWQTEVHLQSSLAVRSVVDCGALQLQAEHGEPLSAQVLAYLQKELAAAPTPAERRHIRQMMKAIRRNPFKPMAWIEELASDEEPTD